jgi:DNA end-binding protein Ku
MLESRHTALAKWAWRAKEYVVQIRPVERGLVLQQLLYAEEVRPIEALPIELAEVGAAELALALRLIEQISADAYDPERFVDEEKQRILAAVERKIAGRSVLARSARAAPSAQVIDLVAALRASLDATAPARPRPRAPDPREGADARERKPARRTTKTAVEAPTTGAKRRRQSAR